jgi:hypothetical protein
VVHDPALQAEAVAAGPLVLTKGVACRQGELTGLAVVGGGWQGQGSPRRLLPLLRAGPVGDVLLQGGLYRQH